MLDATDRFRVAIWPQNSIQAEESIKPREQTLFEQGLANRP